MARLHLPVTYAFCSYFFIFFASFYWFCDSYYIWVLCFVSWPLAACGILGWSWIGTCFEIDGKDTRMGHCACISLFWVWVFSLGSHFPHGDRLCVAIVVFWEWTGTLKSWIARRNLPTFLNRHWSRNVLMMIIVHVQLKLVSGVSLTPMWT